MPSLFTSDSGSDYSYDISAEEETLMGQLVAELSSIIPARSATRVADAFPLDLALETTTEQGHHSNDATISSGFAYPHEPSILAGETSNTFRPGWRWGKVPGFVDTTKPRTMPTSFSPDNFVSYPDLTKVLSRLENESTKQTEVADTQSTKDVRSPLVRFRSFPRKPFSVSDLTAGAWCELQYLYTLTRLPFGKKTRTAAMEQGTKVHQDLEDEVHQTVKIEVTSKEETFGLKFWNLVQGLRTLRDTGLTRELEVWGFVDGNLVNGVIDGLSYENPDPEFQDRLSNQQREAEEHSQTSIRDYFPSQKLATSGLTPRIYLTDVKTRGTLKAPNSPTLLRPAKIQLFLYHRFLSEMASNQFDYLRMFRRYGVDPDELFSDSFIAQMGDLHNEIFMDAESDPGRELVPPSPTNPSEQSDSHSSPNVATNRPFTSSTPDFVKYKSLRELLPLLVSELQLTFQHGGESVGRLLSVEYRYRGDGQLISKQIFPMDDEVLDLFVRGNLEWWKGQREPRGVELEEAFKCRSCEFIDDCSWRKENDEKRVSLAREKLERKQGVIL